MFECTRGGEGGGEGEEGGEGGEGAEAGAEGGRKERKVEREEAVEKMAVNNQNFCFHLHHDSTSDIAPNVKHNLHMYN